MFYVVIFIYLIALRLYELGLARKNEAYQLKRGGIMINDPYYHWIVLVHSLFLFSLIVESYISHQWQQSIPWLLFVIFIILQLCRVYVIKTLGRLWNTKVIINPTNDERVTNGLFRWVKHPNYWIVFFEFICLSLMFHAYLTAFIFPLLHVALMTKRIPLENQALSLYDEK
ncbi:methyltransferase [Alkalibacillus almallahensis]|nr:isoprenylcysteine carboxylmethyltransferase family protein [Alkalibacillus almallahensis]NIK11024.1 methyltransferase [Alkalibacillus almallahensis]